MSAWILDGEERRWKGPQEEDGWVFSERTGSGQVLPGVGQRGASIQQTDSYTVGYVGYLQTLQTVQTEAKTIFPSCKFYTFKIRKGRRTEPRAVDSEPEVGSEPNLGPRA